MDNLFTEQVKQKIRDKKYHYFGNVIDTKGYDMFDFVKFLKNHPNDLTRFADQKRSIELCEMQTRGSCPTFSKEISQLLNKTFIQNPNSCIAFASPVDKHRSFKIHADGMDVLYLQVVGEIQWEIWKRTDNADVPMADDMLPSSGELVEKWHFKPGDLIWVPRGTYHHVVPFTARVGFSYGVESDPDPCTYI